jgi:peptidoglycan/LPS O-acetylase OafA/YrhL
MGFFRLFLALLVVCAHLYPVDKNAAINALTGGAEMAVCVFFLLSGFYMTLVLDNKYINNTRDFFLSRFLRLYPLYWMTLVLTLLGCWLSQYSNFIMPSGINYSFYIFFHNIFTHFNPLSFVVFFQNITFIGLDFNKFFCMNPGNSMSLLHGQCSVIAVGSIAVIPQAWTLGTEVLFYLSIPYILRGGSKLILIVSLFTALFNAILPWIGLDYPHTRDIFFVPLIYFMLGVIAFKAYTRWEHRLPGKRAYWPLVLFTTSLLLAYTFNFNYGMFRGETRFWHGINFIYYFVIALLVPAVFHASKESKFDSFIGELSYPIYITHCTLGFGFALTLRHWLGFEMKQHTFNFACYILCVIAVALVSYLMVVRPIEVFRGRRTIALRRSAQPILLNANT